MSPRKIISCETQALKSRLGSMPGGNTADVSSSVLARANGFRAPTRTALGAHAVISLPRPLTRAPTGPHGMPRGLPRAPVHGMSRGLLWDLTGCHAGLPGSHAGSRGLPEGLPRGPPRDPRGPPCVNSHEGSLVGPRAPTRSPARTPTHPHGMSLGSHADSTLWKPVGPLCGIL